MTLQIEHLAIVVGLFVCITAITCFLYIRDIPRLRKKYADRMVHEKTSFLLDPSDVDDRCDACFGDVTDEKFVIECGCGKVYHGSCAKAIIECPYCHEDVGSRAPRKIRRMHCPRCGRDMNSSICRCGAVLPRLDGTFECLCGNTIHISSERCPICGARYGTVKNQINDGTDEHPWSSNP